jgi:hypothetical protein
LRIVLATKSERISIGESANNIVVNRPHNRLSGPLDSVRAGGANRIGDRVVNRSIVGSGISLSKEVALDLGIVGSKPLPINLIEVVGFEDETADNTGTGTGLGSDRDLSKHDVLVAAYGRSLAACDDEFSTLGAIR